MNDRKAARGLVQTWVTVSDKQGRTHLEARWVDQNQVGATKRAA